MALNLSEKQHQIVDYGEGAILVKAGPGSGKTRVLIERIKNLLKRKKRCKILALTFSNMAAEEMKERLVDDSELDDLVDNVTVGTIHSFALDLVQRRGNLIGLGDNLTLFENNSDRQKLLREAMIRIPDFKNTLKKEMRPEKYLNDCLELIAEQKKKFISPESFDGNESLKMLYKEYNDILREQNVLDYDDILFYAYRILMENPSIQDMYSSLYKYVFVDEAQDLNFAQYELIKALCGNSIKNVMFVGDENQSIYGFNGSNSDLMCKYFVSDFNPTIFVLHENFRSAKSIVEYANKLEDSDSVSNYFYEGELRAFECENENEEADFVVQMINKLKRQGHPDVEKDIENEDIAIIARNRYALSQIEEKLNAESIPFSYKKSINGIENESDFFKVFDLSVRMLLNPKDSIHMQELKLLLNDSREENVSNLLMANDYKLIVETFTYMEDDNFDFSKVLKSLKEELLKETKYSEEEKYLILGDLTNWEKHWRKYCSMIPRENRSLLSFRNSISLGKTQENEMAEGISLLTAHMSKGLQYEVVFVVGLAEGTFPDYRAVASGGKEIEQEKNNMFVATTRAKRLCYLTYPKYKMMPWGANKFQKKSRFLNYLFVEKYVPND